MRKLPSTVALGLDREGLSYFSFCADEGKLTDSGQECLEFDGGLHAQRETTGK